MKKRKKSICKVIRSSIDKALGRSLSTTDTESSPGQAAISTSPANVKSSSLPDIPESVVENNPFHTLTWQPGYQLGSGEFTIERELGRGGFGITYLAQNRKGNLFVIKTIINQANAQTREQWAEFWEDFANEAVKLAQCGGHNTHIVKLYKIVREKELPCIVMEYIEGETLASIVGKGVLEERLAVKYITQIGTALTEIHRQGLLHRDVKPLNIMVRNNGTGAVLIDFGIARKFASGIEQTYLPAVTPGFAPIEQYQWRSIQDAYTDVYALAATLYFALTGQKPLTADKRCNGIPLTPPNQINPQISPRVNQAIIKGLNLQGKDRPQSVELFIRELIASSKKPIAIVSKELSKKNNLGNTEYPEGSLANDSPYYVQRPHIDRPYAQEILKPGAVIRIKAARLMGKTSLINQIVDISTKKIQSRTVRLNLLEADRKVLANSNWFLRWICGRVAKELKLPHQLKERWDDDLYSPTSNCTDYFKDYILPQLNCPLVLSFDEVDRIFPYQEVAPDFFAMLRVWHDKASSDRTWKQLRLIVAHSTEVYIKLKLTQSPFNVGVGKELTDFNATQVTELASCYQLNWNDSQVAKIMREVGGHPHLLRLATYHIARGETTVDTLLSRSISDAGIYGNHLKRFLWSLQQDKQLIEAYKQIVNADSGIQLNPEYRLWLSRMGLIRINRDGLAIPKCNLYRQYFQKTLGS